MTLPAFRSTTTNAPGFVASGSTTVAVPATPAILDVALICTYRENTDVIASSGFTLLTSMTATDHKLSLLWKRLSAVDTGNYTATFVATSSWTDISAVLVSGCITTGDPWDPAWVTGINNTAANNMPSLNFTTAYADELLVYAGSNISGASAWTAPSGMTLRVNSTSLDHMVATGGQAVAGATGAKQGTKTGTTGRSTAFLGGLIPATASVTPSVKGNFLVFF